MKPKQNWSKTDDRPAEGRDGSKRRVRQARREREKSRRNMIADLAKSGL